MLFYRKVRLAVTRHSLKQLIVSLGPDVAVEVAKNVDLIYLDRDFALRTEDRGTHRERHRPATIAVMDSVQRAGEVVHLAQPLDSLVFDLFREVTGASGRGKRRAKQFLNQVKVHDFDPALLGLARQDWEDEALVRQVLVDLVQELAPAYSLPDDFKVSLVPSADEHYQFETNLDWAAVSRAGGVREGDLLLDPAKVLLGMVEMRQDLALGASLGSSLTQDRIGERITRTKVKELVAQLDGQQTKIDQFQELVVKGVGDLRGAIKSGRRSFEEFLNVLQKAGRFRDWVDGQAPTSDLVDEYYANAFKKSPLERHPFKELRWMIPTAVEYGLIAVHAEETAPPAALGMVALDQLVVARFSKGWRPATFINDELVPFVNG
ncbi:hypothetical protein CP978_25455 [Streptomyces nodosus]|uniref:Uncharacterized protein n=2 Tax=Streptomyces nodosus TaxID=40318 RepID=A0A5P2W9E7_9ACTN|nr:hypothetical protein CP978_25455 [Streptomyces nodosus]